MPSKQTSWFVSLLGSLNLITGPITVTCWYCNQNTQLFPGSRETEHYWHCNNCENINVRDQNGEIVDNLPPMHDASLNRPIRPARSDNTPPPIPSSSRTICENCQKKLSHIYKIMNDYIPDESDPQYEHHLETADEYKRKLEEKYPLCADCQSKVDDVVAEHKGDLHERRFYEKYTWGQSNMAPRKMSRQEYQSKMKLWTLLHGLVLLFCVHTYYFPRVSNESRTVAEDANDLRTTLEELLESITTKSKEQSWNSIIFDMLISLLLKLGSSLRLWLCMVACFTTEDNGYCEKDSSRGLFPLLGFWLFSFLWMDWHYVASRTYLETGRIKRWWLYKLVQRVLYIARIGILFALRYWDTPSLGEMVMLVLVIYFLLLMFSVFVVKVPSSKRATKKIGSNNMFYMLKKMYPELRWFSLKKFGKKLTEAAWYTRTRGSSESLVPKAEEDETLKAINRKRAEFGLESRPASAKRASFSKDPEVEVDGLTSGLNCLALDIET